MSRVVWRIATDTPDYEADDLTGAGAKATRGRWNAPGVPVVYASESRALACLETVVHLNAGGLPLNRYLVRIEVPEAAWRAAERVDPAALVGWDAEPAGRAGLRHGTEWARSGPQPAPADTLGDRPRGAERPVQPPAPVHRGGGGGEGAALDV